MASFDKHSRCARCRDKGHGEDPCVKNLACEFCDLLTPEQLLQLSTPTYKIRKEKQKSKEVLVDPSTVTVVSQAEQEGTDCPSSVNSSVEFSLPAPSFCKELQDLDEKWSVRMARLEALLTMGQRPPSQQPSFSPVKVPVTHQAPAGALSQTPFIQSSVPSGQAGPASGPDGTHTATESSMNMSSPLENLYPEADSEPVFFNNLVRYLLLCLLPARCISQPGIFCHRTKWRKGKSLNQNRMITRTQIPERKTKC